MRLIEFVRTYLDGFGIAATRIPGAGRDEGEPVVGPIGKRSIGLSNHSDCVPVKGQAWSSDSFTLELRDGKLYGHGACDMEGFLACVLASVLLFISSQLKGSRSTSSSLNDEEVGCTGVRPLIARLGHDPAASPRYHRRRAH